MSGKDLQNIAQNDAKEVRLPDGWPGVVAWAATKFGVSAIFAAVLLWGISEIYRDQKMLNERVLAAFQEQTQALVENRAALDKLAKAVDDVVNNRKP